MDEPAGDCGGSSELQLLRAEQAELGRLLRSVAADVRRAAEIAASVQRRLGRVQSERRAAAEAGDAELHRLLNAASEVQLQLFIEPSGRRVAASLPLDATVADVQTAAHEAGGPSPAVQELAVGGQRLRACWRPLRETGLVSSGACVVVRRRCLQHRSASIAAQHGVVLLESGEVRCWGRQDFWSPLPDFSPGSVSSVHAGAGFTAAVVAGKLRMWGRYAVWFGKALRQLDGRELVCCCTGSESIPAVTAALAAVVGGGDLLLWDSGGTPVAVPAGVDRVAVVAIGGDVRKQQYSNVVVALTADGAVCMLRVPKSAVAFCLSSVTRVQVGGRAASISAGHDCLSVLLEDGTLELWRSAGSRSQEWVCEDVAHGAVAGECSSTRSFALQADGRLWCRDGGSSQRVAAGCVAVAAGPTCVVGVTAVGRLVLAHAAGSGGVCDVPASFSSPVATW